MEENLDENYFYGLLNLDKTATPNEINSAYRRLSKLYHPDKHSSDPQRKAEAELLFMRLKRAYDVLSDPHQRAIYDSLGERGLEIDGWELVSRQKTPQEIREEYENIRRKNEEQRLLQATNQKVYVDVTLNCSDWFAPYDDIADELDYVEYRLPEVHSVGVHHSIEVPLTTRDTTIVTSNASITNGNGNATVGFAWRRLFTTGNWVESEFTCGNGPQLSLRAFNILTKHVYNTTSILGTATDNGLAGGFQTVTAVQLNKNIMGTIEWKAGMSSSMRATLTRHTEKTHTLGLIQFGLPHSFAFLSYSYSAEKGKYRMGIRGGTFGYQFEYGVEKKVSKHTTVSATMTLGTPIGVVMKLRVIRANNIYSFPVHLSDEVVPAAIFYGSLFPIVSYYMVKTFIIDPYKSRQKVIEAERLRSENREKLAQLRREAETSVKLMMETYARTKRDEETKNGLIILEAFYGSVKEITDASTASLHVNEQVLKVEIQLQCLVQDSKLILHPMSKSNLPGFFDPCAGEDKQLYIKYMYSKNYYQVKIMDNEALSLPKASHRRAE